MGNKTILLIMLLIVGLTACNNEEDSINTKSTIEAKTILLDGVSYKVDMRVEPQTGEELELIEGKDAEIVEAFFEMHPNYSTYINTDKGLEQYFSTEKKMKELMKIGDVGTNTIKSYGNGLIKLYEGAPFEGRVYSKDIPPSGLSEPDFNNVIIGGSHFNDLISSFAVYSSGVNTKVNLTFYENANYTGKTLTYSGRYADSWHLGRKCMRRILWICRTTWNDEITSFKVTMSPISGGGSGGGGGGGQQN